jgi:predicted nucleotide-binding protein
MRSMAATDLSVFCAFCFTIWLLVIPSCTFTPKCNPIRCRRIGGPQARGKRNSAAGWLSTLCPGAGRLLAMTEKRAEWGGLLPPEQAIEALTEAADEGRKLLRRRREDFGESHRDWAAHTEHVLRRSVEQGPEAIRAFYALGPAKMSGPEQLYLEFATKDQIKAQVRFIEQKIEELRFDLRHLATPATQAKPAPIAPPSNKVFVVHGHDHGAKEAVARRILELGLKPIILHEQPSGGKTVIEKIERNADVGFAVVLLTPDDLGAAKQDSKKLLPRARQNVILELGFFFGKLGRDRVFALRVDGVEMPSDTLGIVYEPFTMEGGAWRSKLAQELREAGLPVKADA